MKSRVVSFIDGLNLYHAIVRLKQPHLKWLDLHALSKKFIKPISEELTNIFYFSSHAFHIHENEQHLQKSYLRALELRGIKVVLGHFKEKDRRCPQCSHHWRGHEEKETDVNIALTLLDLAYQDFFDRAIVITNDSDLAPAIQKTRERFPHKKITTVVPPHYYHSNELIKVSTDKSKIRLEFLEKCLLPEVVTDASRMLFVNRPREYAPLLV